MTARKPQSALKFVPNAARAALLLPFVLVACSGLALPEEGTPASGPNPSYRNVIAKYLEKSFEKINTYDSFEISEFRWVHSIKGWTWLACLHFQDHGHLRTYAFFLKANEIVDSRFAVETDGCATQSYTPLDLMPNAAKPKSSSVLEPLY